MPSEDDEAIDVLSVPQVAATQKDLVHAYWRHYVSHVDSALKAVELIIRVLALNEGPLHHLQHLLISVEAEVNELFDALLVLEIGLSIEVLGLDVAKAFGGRAVEQDQVRWEVLVPAYFDDHAYMELFPLQLLEVSALVVAD